jgi:Flp pilus assembly protein TadD
MTPKMLRNLVGVSAAILAVAGSTPTLAQAAEKPPVDAPAASITLLRASALIPAEQRTADQQAVLAAYKAMQTGGYAALEAHLPKLREVLDHAPATYDRVELNGEEVVVHSLPGEDVGALSLAALMSAAAAKKSVHVENVVNVYPFASLMLGSFAVEKNRPQEAIAALDRGLALQPRNLSLVTEKGSALQRLGRNAEVLALYDAALAPGGLFDITDPKDKARLQRGRGYALVELNHLDEAEAAYQAALKLEPGDARATRELQYIAGLRAGAKPNAGTISVPGNPSSVVQPTVAAPN